MAVNVRWGKCFEWKKNKSQPPQTHLYVRRDASSCCIYTKVDAQCDKLATVVGRTTRHYRLATVNMQLHYSRVWETVTEESIYPYIFGNTRVIPSNTVYKIIREYSICQKQARFVQPIQYNAGVWQTDRETDRHMALADTAL